MLYKSAVHALYEGVRLLNAGDASSAAFTVNLANNLFYDIEPKSPEVWRMIWRAELYSIYADSLLGNVDYAKDRATDFLNRMPLLPNVDGMTDASKIKAQACYLLSKLFLTPDDIDPAAVRCWIGEAHAALPLLEKAALIRMLFGLAQFNVLLEEYALAAKCWDSANTLKTIDATFNRALYSDFFCRDYQFVQKNLNGFNDTVDYIYSANTSTDHPVFIVGFPRSGSTLIESILCTQENVLTASENDVLDDLIGEEITGSSPPDFNNLRYKYAHDIKVAVGEKTKRKVVVDKTLQNIMHLGFIMLAFPNASVIFATRDKEEAIFSAYKQLFSSGNEWSYSWEDASFYYDYCARTVSLFTKDFPDQIHTVVYEDLVADFDITVRRLFSFLNINKPTPYENFWNSDRPIYTASFAQVRRPLYNSSVSGLEPYREHLDYFKK